MKFWHTSAIVPLIFDEEGSVAATDLLTDDEVQVVWWGTRAECQSAIRRRERDGLLTLGEIGRANELLEVMTNRWTEVQPVDQIRTQAIRLLAVHPLRTADAFQLAAASSWHDSSAGRVEFVCLDSRLSDAAAREGFRTLPTA